jgi:hypothetical protein
MLYATLQGMSDELVKIAEEATTLGRLVNGDVGKNQFPDNDSGGKDTAKRPDRNRGLPSHTSSSPNPETHNPDSGPANGGFTYD